MNLAYVFLINTHKIFTDLNTPFHFVKKASKALQKFSEREVVITTRENIDSRSYSENQYIESLALLLQHYLFALSNYGHPDRHKSFPPYDHIGRYEVFASLKAAIIHLSDVIERNASKATPSTPNRMGGFKKHTEIYLNELENLFLEYKFKKEEPFPEGFQPALNEFRLTLRRSSHFRERILNFIHQQTYEKYYSGELKPAAFDGLAYDWKNFILSSLVLTLYAVLIYQFVPTFEPTNLAQWLLAAFIGIAPLYSLINNTLALESFNLQQSKTRDPEIMNATQSVLDSFGLGMILTSETPSNQDRFAETYDFDADSKVRLQPWLLAKDEDGRIGITRGLLLAFVLAWEIGRVLLHRIGIRSSIQTPFIILFSPFIFPFLFILTLSTGFQVLKYTTPLNNPFYTPRFQLITPEGVEIADQEKNPYLSDKKPEDEREEEEVISQEKWDEYIWILKKSPANSYDIGIVISLLVTYGRERNRLTVERENEVFQILLTRIEQLHKRLLPRTLTKVAQRVRTTEDLNSFLKIVPETREKVSLVKALLPQIPTIAYNLEGNAVETLSEKIPPMNKENKEDLQEILVSLMAEENNRDGASIYLRSLLYNDKSESENPINTLTPEDPKTLAQHSLLTLLINYRHTLSKREYGDIVLYARQVPMRVKEEVRWELEPTINLATGKAENQTPEKIRQQLRLALAMPKNSETFFLDLNLNNLDDVQNNTFYTAKVFNKEAYSLFFLEDEESHEILIRHAHNRAEALIQLGRIYSSMLFIIGRGLQSPSVEARKISLDMLNLLKLDPGFYMQKEFKGTSKNLAEILMEAITDFNTPFEAIDDILSALYDIDGPTTEIGQQKLHPLWDVIIKKLTTTSVDKDEESTNVPYIWFNEETKNFEETNIDSPTITHNLMLVRSLSKRGDKAPYRLTEVIAFLTQSPEENGELAKNALFDISQNSDYLERSIDELIYLFSGRKRRNTAFYQENKAKVLELLVQKHLDDTTENSESILPPKNYLATYETVFVIFLRVLTLHRENPNTPTIESLGKILETYAKLIEKARPHAYDFYARTKEFVASAQNAFSKKEFLTDKKTRDEFTSSMYKLRITFQLDLHEIDRNLAYRIMHLLHPNLIDMEQIFLGNINPINPINPINFKRESDQNRDGRIFIRMSLFSLAFAVPFAIFLFYSDARLIDFINQNAGSLAISMLILLVFSGVGFFLIDRYKSRKGSIYDQVPPDVAANLRIINDNLGDKKMSRNVESILGPTRENIQLAIGMVNERPTRILGEKTIGPWILRKAS